MNIRRRHLIGVAAAACAAVATAPPLLQAQELAPRQIAAEARPAVVMITAMAGERASGQGSGFVVSSDGLVITNHHVVEGADALRVRLSSGEIYDDVYLVSSDRRRDLVVLRIPAADLASLTIGDDSKTDIGDPIYVMGNPLGLEGTFSNGLVSGKRILDGIELIQISAPISSGSSGGPVLNARGEVIGIATAMMREGQNLNLAVPARFARGMLAPDEPPRPFSQVASQVADSETGDSETADEQDAEPWLVVLRSEMEVAADIADELDLRPTHDAVFEMIGEGASHEVQLSFDPGRAVVIIGVCDLDCSDLDLTVYDPEGEVVAVDAEIDDRPIVGFDVLESGLYDVHVYMAGCSREPCGFVIQPYETRRAPRHNSYAPSGSLIKELQAGFEDVTPGGWDEWTQSIADVDAGQLQQWSRRAVIAHTTDTELIDVLAWRSRSYRSVADDPVARRACSLAASRTGAVDASAFDLRAVARITGRALARGARGDAPWTPTVELSSDEDAWKALGTYLADRGRLLFVERLLVLAEGETLDERTSCLWQAELYDMAVRSPTDRIGEVTLLEFVRAMEMLGQAAASGDEQGG